MLLMIELATSTSIELPRETSLALARFGKLLFELFVVGIKLQCSLIGSSRTGLFIRFQKTVPYPLETVRSRQLFTIAR